MQNQRPPRETPADIDDFRRSNWEAILHSRPIEGTHTIWSSLADAAKHATEAGDPRVAKILWMLADACSMMLRPESTNKPLVPFFSGPTGRSPIPDDFSRSDVTLLGEICEEVHDPWLKSRLADIVWLVERPRNPRFALVAVDAYRSLPTSGTAWHQGAGDCWRRALTLVRQLRGGARDRAQEIELALLSAFEATPVEDGNHLRELSDLLFDFGLGSSKENEIAAKLKVSGDGLDNSESAILARGLFVGAAKWYDRIDAEEEKVRMAVKEAESWVKEAEQRENSDGAGFMVASSFYESAIRAYRSISRKNRATLGLNARIDELCQRKARAGRYSLEEMATIRSGSIDVSDMVIQAQKAVAGKSAIEALRALANIVRGPNEAELRLQAKEGFDEHPLSMIFGEAHLSSDGRVVAKRPSLRLDGTDQPKFDLAVWAQMVKSFKMEVELETRAVIWPALQVLQAEHRLREQDFVQLANACPIVLMDREELWGKGLYFGFDGDLASSLHLLLPQLEHLVRCQLKASDVKTITMDNDGVENEIGLSALMDLELTKEVLGADLSFEISALLCDPIGPNLRNEVAHGLLSSAACASTYSLYAWWLCLRIVVNSYFAARTQGQAASNG